MASVDVLQQIVDRQVVRTGRFAGVKRLLAEYRRAVAAETFYDRLRHGSRKVPRSEITRAVFDELYADGADQPRRLRRG